jgi:hypothetical protein
MEEHEENKEYFLTTSVLEFRTEIGEGGREVASVCEYLNVFDPTHKEFQRSSPTEELASKTTSLAFLGPGRHIPQVLKVGWNPKIHSDKVPKRLKCNLLVRDQ